MHLSPESAANGAGTYNYGPIPEGEYLLYANDTQNWSDVSGIDKALANIGRGPWPGGVASWGEHRIWATPVAGTNTYGRSGFSVHGGFSPGSAGCVDLTSHMGSFTNQFNSYFQQNQFKQSIVLRVSY